MKQLIADAVAKRYLTQDQVKKGQYLWIQSLTAQLYVVPFIDTKTLTDVKRDLAAISDLDPLDMRLIFAGVPLRDDCPLYVYNIQKGATLNLVLRLRPKAPLVDNNDAAEDI